MSLIAQAARKVTNPFAMQKMISSLPYNDERHGETIRSAEAALKAKSCHCLEAVFISAAILEQHDYEPLVLSMESQDKLDHVVFLFQEKSGWGSIGQSRDQGLHGRAPQFKSIEDLVRSYFVPYVDRTGRIQSYQVFHLDETQSNWRYSHRNLWQVEQYLGLQKHKPIYFSNSYYRKVYRRFLKKGNITSGKHWW